MVNQQVHPPFKAWLFKCCHCCVFPDNVHFQQAAEISEALVEEQVDFEAMVSNQDNRRRNHRNPSFVLDLADEMCIKHWTFCLLGLISRILMNFLCFSPSGTQTRTTGSAARRINTSTTTWLTSCRGALREVHWINKISSHCSCELNKSALG